MKTIKNAKNNNNENYNNNKIIIIIIVIIKTIVIIIMMIIIIIIIKIITIIIICIVKLGHFCKMFRAFLQRLRAFSQHTGHFCNIASGIFATLRELYFPQHDLVLRWAKFP